MCKSSEYWPDDLKGHRNRCCRWVVVGRNWVAKSWSNGDSEKMCEAKTLAPIRRALAWRARARVHIPNRLASYFQVRRKLRVDIHWVWLHCILCMILKKLLWSYETHLGIGIQLSITWLTSAINLWEHEHGDGGERDDNDLQIRFGSKRCCGSCERGFREGERRVGVKLSTILGERRSQLKAWRVRWAHKGMRESEISSAPVWILWIRLLLCPIAQFFHSKDTLSRDWGLML